MLRWARTLDGSKIVSIEMYCIAFSYITKYPLGFIKHSIKLLMNEAKARQKYFIQLKTGFWGIELIHNS